MSSKFRIYSTEVPATVDPDSLSTAPTVLIVFDQDPDSGNYNPVSNASDRGSTWQTLGGNVRQDFGVVESDEIITFSDSVSLSAAVNTQLTNAYETIDGEWFFTDGYNCWKVRFSRDPKGFKAWRDIFYAYKGKTYFSYEITLLVLSKEV